MQISKIHVLISVLAFFSTESVIAGQPDTLSYYTVSAESHGFMCPFLTPQYIDRINKKFDCSTRKDSELVIHVVSFKNDGLDSEALVQIAELTGYERKNIHVMKIK